MKVRLLAPDSKIPNLAIMKISAFHKQKGDDVGWFVEGEDNYDTDVLYISKVFTFSKFEIPTLWNNCRVEIGGTGYDIKKTLPEEIESITELDYSLYPDCDYSIIFTTRGCVRHCDFCIVREKEGLIHNVPVCNLNPKGKWLRVLDNNFFASPDWRENLKVLKRFNQPIDFDSGIDLRLFNEEQGEALKSCKIRTIHCAFDNYKDKDVIIPKLKLLTKYVPAYKIMVYVLVGFESWELCEKDIERVNLIWEIGAYPFVMVYQDFNNPEWKRSLSCRQFARWCNNRFIFKSCTFEEYLKGRNGRV